MSSLPRFYSCSLTLTAALFLLGWTAPTARAQDSVTINLGSSNDSPLFEGAAGMSLVLTAEQGRTTALTAAAAAGSPARSTTPPAGQEGGYMYFRVNDKFVKEGTVADLWVTVEYLDKGTDFFQLEYDAKDPVPGPNDPDLNGDGQPDLPDTDGDGQPGPIPPEQNLLRPAEFGPNGLPFPTSKTDSGRWLSKTFAITNVWFGNRQNMLSDFRINDMTRDPNAVDEGPEIIRKVTVSKVAPISAVIPLAAAPPKIDGVLDEDLWQTAFKVDVNQKWQVTHPANKATWTDANDYSAVVRLTWDSTALYGAFDVTDDVPRENFKTVPSAQWDGDAVEFYIGLNQANKGRKSYILGKDYQVVIGVGETPMWGILQGTAGGAWDPAANGFPTEEYVAVKDTAKGFIVEIKLPWGMLPDNKGMPNVNVAPAPGSELGFNFFADDSDREDGTSGQDMAMSFSGIPNGWSDPSGWATVRLGSPNSNKGDLNADGSVTVADAVLGLQIAVELVPVTPAHVQAGDYDASGKIEVGDVVKILRKIVGLEN